MEITKDLEPNRHSNMQVMLHCPSPPIGKAFGTECNMNKYLAVRDLRLGGGVPSRPRLSIVNTDENTALSRVFKSINAITRGGGKIHSMFILCHGFAGSNARANMSMDAGGEGLQLGLDNVTHGNVAMWEAIAGKVQHIVVYSCAAANTEPGNQGTTADGAYLMGALAIHTRASVYAADRIQWYSTYKNLSNGAYDFGGWEGKLRHFPPDGSGSTVVHSAPVEFGDVLSGAAP
jgi:hypothetical protein